MMATQPVEVKTLPVRTIRHFHTRKQIANGGFYWPSTARGAKTVPKTTVSLVEMDEATLELMNQLNRCLGIRQLEFHTDYVSVAINDGFLWSDVQDWITACIERRIGLEPSTDATPEVSRKAIYWDFSAGIRRIWVKTTGQVSELKDTGDITRRKATWSSNLDDRLRALAGDLFQIPAIKQFHVEDDTSISLLFKPDQFCEHNTQERLCDIVAKLLGWEPGSYECDRWSSAHSLLAQSDHPIDTFDNHEEPRRLH